MPSLQVQKFVTRLLNLKQSVILFCAKSHLYVCILKSTIEREYNPLRQVYEGCMSFHLDKHQRGHFHILIRKSATTNLFPKTIDSRFLYGPESHYPPRQIIGCKTIDYLLKESHSAHTYNYNNTRRHRDKYFCSVLSKSY